MSSENFNVRWNNYHAVLQSSFPKLLTNEHFVDVTLTCEGRSLRCHKMVLSACSSYFEQLLTESPCQHPIIFLKDMKFWEVEALVDFMYRGEVSVSQDKLASLVQAAESLQIKGLAGSNETEHILPKIEPEVNLRTKHDGPPVKRKRHNKTVPDVSTKKYPEDRKPFPVNLPDLEMIPLPRVVTQLQNDSNNQSDNDSLPPMLMDSQADGSESNEAFSTSVNVKEELNDTEQDGGMSNEECGEDDSLDIALLPQTELLQGDDPLTNPGPSSANLDDRQQGKSADDTSFFFDVPLTTRAHRSLSLFGRMEAIRLHEDEKMSFRKIAAKLGVGKSQIHQTITLKDLFKEKWKASYNHVD